MITIAISPGELFDRLTILELKLEYIADQQKLNNVRHEYEQLLVLKPAYNHLLIAEQLYSTIIRLSQVNRIIWHTEDAIREHERNKIFNDSFIEHARAIYYNNDERSRLKRRINELLESELIEEKSYKDY